MKILLFFLLLVCISPGKKDLLTYLDKNGRIKPVKTRSEWNIKRSQIIYGLEQAMGPLPSRKDLPDLDVKILETKTEASYTRHTITFQAAENERVPAYLFIPGNTGKKKMPAMIALHQTTELGKSLFDGSSTLTDKDVAIELAERGYIVIAPDYPSFGELKDYNFDTDRYESGTMKGIFDHMRCVDLFQARSDVDPGKIGVIGHSLGGHNAMFLGAFDKRIKVVVASCAWTLMDYYDLGERITKIFGGRLGPWAQDRYMPLLRTKYNLDPDKIPFDFDEVIAAIAPRAFFSNSPVNDANFNVDGVRIGIAHSREIYSFLKAEDKIQVRYPEAAHEFPLNTRSEAYDFIDKIMGQP